MSKEVFQDQNSGPEVTLPKGIAVYPSQRLSAYDTGPVKAYAAQTKDKAGSCYALICERHLLPRRHAASVYAGISSPALAPLVHAGPVYWPPARQESFVLVYRSIMGKKIMDEGQKPALGWRPDKAMDLFIKPLAGLLREFKISDFAHGSIRPSNMFEGHNAGKMTTVILGDGLSTPPSYTQPALYEPIARGMADPAGRGPGTFADDVYAFGASLAVLVRSRDPMEGVSEDEMIRAKIEYGSFAVMVGNERLKGSLLEFLRGTLHDDPIQRWTIDEILEWIDGRRLNPKQPSRHQKAPRPVVLAEKKYFLTSFLAMDLPRHATEAYRIVENGEFKQWLTRAVQDDELNARVEKALEATMEGGKSHTYETKLAANISAALDPTMPLHYKGLNVMAQGIGNLLAEAVVLRKDIQPFAEIFAEKIAMNWMYMRESLFPEAGALLGKLDSCRVFLRQPRVGYGIERCLYLLAPEAPCFGEKLKNYLVYTAEDLIRAYEDLCRRGDAPALFIDRHSAAFLSVRDLKMIDPFIRDLDSPEEYRKILGNMKCLASIQKKYKMENFPGIAKAFSTKLPVVYERFHDRQIREKIEKSVRQHVEAGDLFKLASVLDNAEVANRDLGTFRQAMHEYEALTREAADLEVQLADAPNFGRETGRKTAAIIAGIVAGIIVLFVSFLFFTPHATF